MTVDQFLAKYNIENNWIGPCQRNDGSLKVSKYYKKTSQNRAYWHHLYFIIYKCKYCNKNAISINKSNELPVTCSRYSKCFSEYAGIITSKDKIIYTRDNPGISSNGYYYWRGLALDQNGDKISTGNGIKRKYIYLHRVIMEEHLGRKLKSWESVHHIDMVKLNNNISNLWLCTAITHNKAHASYNTICAELMTNYNKYSGIKFNKKTGIYYLKEIIWV